MKSTGIIRRIDDLGRIVIPKEIRRNMGVGEGSPMEIIQTGEGVLLKRYYPATNLSELMSTISEEIEDICNDLGPERTEFIRRRIREIQRALKEANANGKE